MMETTSERRAGIIEANGAEIYHEIRGDGPPVVFIPGAFGDAGNFELIAEGLADTHTTVIYDRRGNSRSPRPDGWTTTSIAEQADDCAALIEALRLERPVVVGNSGGGLILVGFLERHAEMLRGAIVHEPVLAAVCPSAAKAFEELPRIVVEGMADGPLKVLELFARWVFGDEGFEARRGSLDPDVLERMAGNTDVTFGIEAAAFTTFVPDPDALAGVQIPVHAVYGEENEGTWLAEGAEWVSKTTGGPLHALPGAHLPRQDQVPAFVEALRGVLASMR
jgi:pimeloyl-ACP methyl ester carboxylesterase